MNVNTYVRPTMEYAIQAWSPWLQKDTQLLDRIYHRVTKMVDGLQHTPYSERLKSLNMFDSGHRRLRGDLILMFKIMNTSHHPLRLLFTLARTLITRSHTLSVVIPHSRLNCRRYFFTVRVCFTWNSLPDHVVNADNINSFKNLLDRYFSSHTVTEPLSQ